MVTREKSKEALAVASTVTHFTEIVVARCRAIYSEPGPSVDPFVCAREIHSVSESSSVYVHTCIRNINARVHACARVPARKVRHATRSKVLSLSSQLARLNLAIPRRDRLFLCDNASGKGREIKQHPDASFKLMRLIRADRRIERSSSSVIRLHRTRCNNGNRESRVKRYTLYVVGT